jgi:hypothetical protein
MNQLGLVALAATLVTCGDNLVPTQLRLFLDLDGSELRVRLVETEPIPF